MSLLMPVPETPEASDLYSERLIRSVAHNIGNAVNVLSGRLSLLEMEEGMRPESLEMLALMKDRLRRTQAELRGAVRFVSETLRETNGSLPTGVQHVLTAVDDSDAVFGGVAGKDAVLSNEAAQRCRSTCELTFAFNVLAKGVRALVSESSDDTVPKDEVPSDVVRSDSVDSNAPRWSLHARPEGLALEVTMAPALLPSDRRALMEPWFEATIVNLSLPERRGRLEVAVALGRIEDGGANVSVLPSEDGLARLQVLWNYV
jgi:hypothetical protein